MRKAAIILVAILLALGAGSQALSNALSGSQPALAASLSPFAAPAYERSAATLIRADAETNAIDVSEAQVPAQHAVDDSLLATEALAVLALASENVEQRKAILDSALAVSRRGRVLNSAALVLAAEDQDTELLLSTLNRTLLLYPSQQEAIVPLLVEQLSNEQLVPAFVEIFETEPDWGQEFFIRAASDPDLAGNLARVRLGLSPDTAVAYEANRAILRVLARTNRTQEAAQLFARIRSMDEVPVTTGSLGWENEFPPFQWDLYDRDGRFARRSMDGSSIAISARSGLGGLLGRRLIRIGDSTVVFQVEHTLDPGTFSQVRLTLECPETEQRWTDVLGPSPTMMRVDQPLDCEYAWLGIAARSSAGSSAISGEILDITIM